MKIEIWSDIMCPFCYIGKRRLEAALETFEEKDSVEITWKSFQLDPEMKTDPGKNINQYLAERKGWTISHAREMNAHVTQMAEEAGLHYDFDRAVVANSFDAHRLIQLAKKHGKGDLAEERLFKAYFTEGKNIADAGTLIGCGNDIGLDAAETEAMLRSDAFSEEVKNDIAEAMRIGVRGVPFFVFGRKFAVSGAQPEDVFRQALQKAMEANV